MKPPESFRQDAERWLSFAQRDQQIASMLEGKEEGYWPFSMFHCQQAIEKALKGFLVLHDVRFQKTHDLETLGKSVAALDGSLSELLAPLGALTKYAPQSRYPGELQSDLVTVQEVKSAVATAKLVVEEISKRLVGA